MSFFETLAAFATRRPVAVCVTAIAVAIIGFLSWDRRPIDLLPDLQSPTVVVSIRSGDRPPLEMERLFGENLEEQITSVEGVREVDLVARTGRIVATVHFDWNTNVDIGMIDVQKELGFIESNPTVDEVLVRRFDPRQDPILVLGLTQPEEASEERVDLIELRQLARRQIAITLEQLSGVAEVQVTGGRLKEIRVTVDRYRLDAHGVTLSMLEQRLQSENVDLNAGTIEEGTRVYQLRGRSRYEDLDDIENVVIRYLQIPNVGQKAIRVSDIATVTEESQDVDHVVLVNGREGVGLSIYKESGANTVEVSRTIREAIKNIEQDLPNAQLVEIADNAILVVDALEDLQVAAIVGILLAVIVLAAFLRSAGATLIIATAVPVSICGAVFCMHLGNYSLNIITLGGLALGAGMLVDNAIVVVESMFRRLQAGEEPQLAATRGTGQVAGAITASTLTTCVVFLPIFFVEGLAARLIDGIAFTVVFSLLASLLVAVMLIPALGKWFLPRVTSLYLSTENIRETRSGIRTALENTVSRFLDHPFIVVFIAAAIFSTAIYYIMQLGTELLPPSDPKQFSVRIVGPQGQRVETTARTITGIDDIVKEATNNQVVATLAEVGRLPDDDRIIRREQTEENTARLYVRVRSDGPSGVVIANALKDDLEDLQDTNLIWEINRSALSEAIGTSGVPILVEVTGTALPDLRKATDVIKTNMESLPELWNVRSSFEGGPPELRITLDRSMADAVGVNLATVTRVLESSLDGRRATFLTLGDEEYPIVIRTESPTRDDLDDVLFTNTDGRQISLGEVANFTHAEGAREIYRRDQRRVAQITAQLSEGAELPQAVAAVRDVLQNTTIPSGSNARLRGEETERERTFDELTLAGILAIMLVLMVLAGAFESLLQPFTVLASIPLALVGVAIAIVPLGDPVGVMSMLGLIVLSGVAVNDAVLLLATAKQLINEGTDVKDALSRAAGIRLRPITMTTLTTAFALVPLLFGGGEGAVLRQPMALTIIGGLITSTIGSLLVLPCIYILLDKVKFRSRNAV